MLHVELNTSISDNGGNSNSDIENKNEFISEAQWSEHSKIISLQNCEETSQNHKPLQWLKTGLFPFYLSFFFPIEMFQTIREKKNHYAQHKQRKRGKAGYGQAHAWMKFGYFFS